MTNTWYHDEAQRRRVDNITKRWDWLEWGAFVKSFIKKRPKLMSYPEPDSPEKIVGIEVANKTARHKWLYMEIGMTVYLQIGQDWVSAVVLDKRDSYRSDSKNWMVQIRREVDGREIVEWVEAFRLYKRQPKKEAA